MKKKEGKKSVRAEFYRDKNHEYRWRIVHQNGRILADSAEGYRRRSRCVDSIYNLFGYIFRNEFIIKEKA